ncbi:hypothetical protein OIE66_40615 [Nonomuraea sp. NBC_01738]|uniref:hypothetical protein n=1 Tax=Nonomuraea sp. NBC_01738 TaxID=2976003 RepID=UPI002E126F58|nr:hypothetical protein OIE66_40615 [Nonomuraea sp. NBC_01738]
MIQPYQVGEVVTVTFTAVVAATPDVAGGSYTLALSDDVHLDLPLIADGEPDIDVARVTPADGQPVPGQIWADQLDREWFAVVGERGDRDRAVLIRAEGAETYWRDVHANRELGPIRLLRPAPAAGGE